MVDVRGDVLRPPHSTTPAADPQVLRTVAMWYSRGGFTYFHAIFAKPICKLKAVIRGISHKWNMLILRGLTAFTIRSSKLFYQPHLFAPPGKTKSTYVVSAGNQTQRTGQISTDSRNQRVILNRITWNQANISYASWAGLYDSRAFVCLFCMR